MKPGDLVLVDPWIAAHSPWLPDGKTGIVLKVQPGDYCVGAWIILDDEVKLIRVENLTVINESR